MSDTDHILGLLDDLIRLAEEHGASIEVQADGFSASVTPGAGATIVTRPQAPAVATAAAERTQRVHATTVGLFSPARVWDQGDAVARGDVLGGIRSLGHIVDVVAPADGEIREVLVAGGAPVEYGQPLFLIALR